MKKTFLQGSLTKVSAALLTLVQSPNLLAEVSATARVFSDNASAPISYASIVASIGIVFGAVRSAFNYFK